MTKWRHRQYYLLEVIVEHARIEIVVEILLGIIIVMVMTVTSVAILIVVRIAIETLLLPLAPFPKGFFFTMTKHTVKHKHISI